MVVLKMHSCNRCNATFTRNASLKRHVIKGRCKWYQKQRDDELSVIPSVVGDGRHVPSSKKDGFPSKEEGMSNASKNFSSDFQPDVCLTGKDDEVSSFIPEEEEDEEEEDIPRSDNVYVWKDYDKVEKNHS